MQKKLIRFDWAMKRLLRQKANFVILEGFLSELLGEDLKIRNILESEAHKQAEADKYNRVDLLAESTMRRELMLIEVQHAMQSDYFHRMLYGAARLVTEYIHEGQSYGVIRKVYSINIVYFDLGHGEDYVYHGTTNFVGLHAHDVLALNADQCAVYKKTTIAGLFPEYYVIKVNQFNDLARNTLDEWIYFLKNEEIGDATTAKGLREAKKTLDVLKLPESERAKYRRYVESLRDEASWVHTQEALRAEGRETGLAEAKKEIARKMLADGFEAATIAKLSGLTVSEIEALATEPA